MSTLVGIAVALGGPASAACPPAPLAGCRLATKSLLKLTDQADDAGDALVWSWSRGPHTTVSDFGDPTGGTTYSLCLYAGTTLVSAIDVPAQWASTGSSGFTFDDDTMTTGLRSIRLKTSSSGTARVIVKGRGEALPDLGAPTVPLMVQLVRSDVPACFESVFDAATVRRNDSGQFLAKGTATSIPALGSPSCGTASTTYPLGTSTDDSVFHDGTTRTFRVFVPPGYDASGDTPAPVVIVLHGGFGSGAQIEANSRVIDTAIAEGFIAIAPDGVPGTLGIRTWNGGGCCGFAASTGVDDVGFIRAMLDHVEDRLCIDRRRVYATGISNGGILAYRLACELADRIQAIGPVAAGAMFTPCAPVRPIPVMHVHGTGDLHIPFEGGVGCGPSGVTFPSVDASVGGAAARSGCTGSPATTLTAGDGTCRRQGRCSPGADVVSCVIDAGGHVWPGGTPPASPGSPGCLFGHQSQTFAATPILWDFFAQHPPR